MRREKEKRDNKETKGWKQETPKIKEKRKK